MLTSLRAFHSISPPKFWDCINDPESSSCPIKIPRQLQFVAKAFRFHVSLRLQHHDQHFNSNQIMTMECHGQTSSEEFNFIGSHKLLSMKLNIAISLLFLCCPFSIASSLHQKYKLTNHNQLSFGSNVPPSTSHKSDWFLLLFHVFRFDSIEPETCLGSSRKGHKHTHTHTHTHTHSHNNNNTRKLANPTQH